MSKSVRKAAARAKRLESYKNAQPNFVLWVKCLREDIKRNARTLSKKD